MILRPDSGDPTEAVIMALQAAEKVFGVDVNSKGYKVPRGCGVIQGDGVKYEALAGMLHAILKHKYSAQVGVSCKRGCIFREALWVSEVAGDVAALHALEP